MYLADLQLKAHKTKPKAIQVLLSCTSKIVHEKNFCLFNADYNDTGYTCTSPETTTW